MRPVRSSAHGVGHKKIKHLTNSTSNSAHLQAKPFLHPVRTQGPLSHAIHAYAFDALPVECRSASASLDVGWLRFLVDACDPPEPDECGVVALSSLFELSDAVWVGIRVGDDEDELAPRQLPGAKFPATPGDLG